MRTCLFKVHRLRLVRLPAMKGPPQRMAVTNSFIYMTTFLLSLISSQCLKISMAGQTITDCPINLAINEKSGHCHQLGGRNRLWVGPTRKAQGTGHKAKTIIDNSFSPYTLRRMPCTVCLVPLLLLPAPIEDFALRRVAAFRDYSQLIGWVCYLGIF